MFFDDILVKNKVLEKVWRAGNGQISEECDENTSLPKICENLDRWVDSEAMDASRRMSLRTSSVLIDGAAKLYKKGMQQLFEDVAKLDEEMVLRNRRNSNSFKEDDKDFNTSSSRSYEAPEQMMRQAEIHPDISFEAQPSEISLSPVLDRSHSFINSCSTQSPKRQSNETFDSNGQPKKRMLGSDQSKELDNTSYPSSLTSDSSVKTTDNVSSDSQSESDSTDRQTNDNRPKTDSFDHSSRQVARYISTNQRLSKIYALESFLGGQTIKRSTNSPTFTEIFDIMAGDNDERQTDNKNTTNYDTNSKTCNNIPIERNCDNRTKKNSNIKTADRISDKVCRASMNEGSEVRDHESQRSIILKSSKMISRARRDKKGPKSVKKRKDQASQTVSFSPRMNERDADTFDENLPFGYLLIHDTIRSRIPSKIVFSSLTGNINNLFSL